MTLEHFERFVNIFLIILVQLVHFCRKECYILGMHKQTLSIKEAAEFLKISVSTVKRLANTNRLPCYKTPGNHRRFELRALQKFRNEMDPKYDSEFSAHRWFNLILNEPDHLILYSAILQERAKFGSWYKVADAIGEVIYEIGQKWQEGECSILEEHIVSKRLERALASCISSIQIGTNPPRCLLLSVQGDMHTLGLSLAELCIREQGWLNVWLGSQVDISDLNIFLRENPFDMVAVSASVCSSDESKLSNWYREVADICRKNGSLLVLGGNGSWPKKLSYGNRFTKFEDFANLLKELS